VLEDDPGRDLGEALQPGHRFFFELSEVEPLAGEPPPSARVLVAGIGNVFLGDDAFGVELAGRLAARKLPGGVEVVDFGIRGMDLAFALQEDLDAAVLLDAVPRGGEPGTLYVIEPEVGAGAAAAVEAHGMDPVKVLALARRLGRLPARVLVVGCEPASVGSLEDGDMRMELSEPVRAALEPAVELVEELLGELTTGQDDERRGPWAS
jgi:hydrogenase maturation protease